MRPALAQAMAGPTERQRVGPAEDPGHSGHPEHRAEDLTRGGRAALIRFNGQVYTLRITRQGKLLLTK